jgi:hypothetical protein
LTGAALGVNCSDQPLPFFPSIYNEDWFFFTEYAAKRTLSSAGVARQRKYNPFDDPGRAKHQEFGDLLAEGMYALIEASGDPFRPPNRNYWRSFTEARHSLLCDIANSLSHRLETHETVQALRSIEAALAQHDLITLDHCIEFLEAWQHDRHRFMARVVRLSTMGSWSNALDFLELRAWRSARFGITDVAGRFLPI